MRAKTLWAWVWVGLGTTTVSCSRPSEAPAAADTVAQAAAQSSVLLPRQAPTVTCENAIYDVGAFLQISTDLAEDPRRATVVALCTPCHSARYITGQPPLNAAVWQAEVTKMVEGFAAVVPPDKVADVLGYLSDHYGASRGDASGASASPAPTVPDPAPGSDGAGLYKVHCIACHGATGQGTPGAFPPLAQHAAALGQSTAGRNYIIDVVLHGLVGAIQVDGAAYNNMMPPLGTRLTDADIAAVLNNIRQTWPQTEAPFAPVTAADVAAQRGREKSPQQVYASRPSASP